MVLTGIIWQHSGGFYHSIVQVDYELSVFGSALVRS